MNSSVGIGVQTDNDGDCVKIDLEGDLSSRFVLQKKLLGIWSSTSDQNIGRDIISKVFMSCQRDFHRLFGCMSVKLFSKVPAASVACGCSSDVTSLGNLHSFPSSEAAKVSHLFSVLAKVYLVMSFSIDMFMSSAAKISVGSCRNFLLFPFSINYLD